MSFISYIMSHDLWVCWLACLGSTPHYGGRTAPLIGIQVPWGAFRLPDASGELLPLASVSPLSSVPLYSPGTLGHMLPGPTLSSTSPHCSSKALCPKSFHPLTKLTLEMSLSNSSLANTLLSPQTRSGFLQWRLRGCILVLSPEHRFDDRFSALSSVRSEPMPSCPCWAPMHRMGSTDHAHKWQLIDFCCLFPSQSFTPE